MGCLKNLVITAVGDLGPGKGNEQLKKWVEANTGRWMPRLTKGVTHLICSKEAYKKNVDAVKQAKKLGIFIISYDWLEDSLQSRRKLAERKYTWEVLRKERRNRKEIKRLAPKADTIKFKKGCNLAREELDSGTSRKSKSAFFMPALQDLGKKREAREAREAEAKTATKAVRTATPEESQNSTKTATVPLRQAATPRPVAQNCLNAQGEPQLQPEPEPTTQPQCISQEASPLTSPLTSPLRNHPTPSIFPPSLKSTAPTPSLVHLTKPMPTPPTPSPSTSKSSATPEATVAASEEPKVTKLTDLYHIYTDATGFQYNLMLLRQNPYLNNFAKYTLRLYESHTKPYVYAVAVKYTPPAGRHTRVSDDFSEILGNQTQAQKMSKLTAATTIQPNPPRTPSLSQSPPTTSTSPSINPEAARLTALITPQTPTPTRPYTTLPIPTNSPFAPALLAFRHIFRDLTLLTWEERLTPTPSVPNSLQRLRAQAFQIEPFVWRAPAPGLPAGVMPQIPGAAAADTAYVRNRWGLPALDEPLGEEGVVGSALRREAVEAKRRAGEEEKRKVEDMKRREGSVNKTIKPNYKRPLFNGVNGRPRQDEFGKYFQSGVPGAGAGGWQSASPAPRRARGAMGGGFGVRGARGASAGVGGSGAVNGGMSSPGQRRGGRAVFTHFPVPKSRSFRHSSFFGDR
ncbi:hypothetical protein K458DRAFT_135836 [Lentithecium fluviatile CBS 122367]|uniref:BRCT domain-containing protein n=1 Tax=Lentithecium fluviatile CBS 122367 TaxID=1168545 RepID=A0A6G1IKC3_9PLEO|nr:hypothetical protein K458DRAFT_135836 [Lentithecium fluviatile CBS 122367]